MLFNLLEEPLIGVEELGVNRFVTLPELLRALAEGRRLSFTGLQPHQHLSWYAFLVQLAAMALNASGATGTNGFNWMAGLLGLTNQSREPWCLVVEDMGLPAFMQAPLPDRPAEWVSDETSPDGLDILLTGKNHHIKLQRMVAARPEHWVYALINLQTTQGYLGVGNFGIARMNGGTSSRPMVGIVPSTDWSDRFRRDLAMLLANRNKLVVGFGYAGVGGHQLLWLVPWDGAGAIALNACDPFFLEVCRRVRLEATPVGIVSHATKSEGTRIAGAKAQMGNIGDAWMPVEIKGHKSLSVGKGGFGYGLVQELLFGDKYQWGVAQELRPEDGEMPILLAQALSRGNGITEGLHRREILLPPVARRLLGRPEERTRMGVLAKRRVELAAKAKTDVLMLALRIVCQGDPAKLDHRAKDGSARWAKRFDQEVDSIFFDEFWGAAEQSSEETKTPEAFENEWITKLLDLATQTLEVAMAEVPMASTRKYRIRAAAERAFYGRRLSVFPGVTATTKGVPA